MNLPALPPKPTVNVIELNRFAPRPFVFTEAAQCLRHSIRLSGYPSALLRNDADPAAWSIVFGAWPGEPLLNRLDLRRTLLFNLEQLGSVSTLAGADYQRWLQQHLVLDFQSHNVAHLRQGSADTVRCFEIPIVPSAALASVPEPATEPSVDVVFFGTVNPRRQAILTRLQAAGLTVEIVCGAYATELTPALHRARLVLNVHFYDTRLFPVLRVLQAAALGVPVVSETSVHARHSDWSNSGVLFADGDDLVDACRSLLASPQQRLARAQRNLRFAASLGFAPLFDAAMAAVGAHPAATA